MSELKLKLSDGLKEATGSISGEDVDGPLEVLSIFSRLKQTKRTGWVMRGVENPESISDHCFRVAMFGMYLALEDPSLDLNKVVKMGLVHDCGESIVGDVTPCEHHISEALKSGNEDKALWRLDEMGGKEILYPLWREFEDGKTPEAAAVKQLDKLEMILQAVEYERSQGLVLDDFFESSRKVFKHPVIVRWAKQIEAQRKK